mmetsp:Transcript_96608/g.258295  ORF Transcript_96608/g.258295 Transcript_96608/m.258295 type:complete len:240 (+) Transcript_96608:363-1082(+)
MLSQTSACAQPSSDGCNSNKQSSGGPCRRRLSAQTQMKPGSISLTVELTRSLPAPPRVRVVCSAPHPVGTKHVHNEGQCQLQCCKVRCILRRTSTTHTLFDHACSQIGGHWKLQHDLRFSTVFLSFAKIKSNQTVCIHFGRFSELLIVVQRIGMVLQLKSPIHFVTSSLALHLLGHNLHALAPLNLSAKFLGAGLPNNIFVLVNSLELYSCTLNGTVTKDLGNAVFGRRHDAHVSGKST